MVTVLSCVITVVTTIKLNMVGLQPENSPDLKEIGRDFTGNAHLLALKDAGIPQNLDIR